MKMSGKWIAALAACAVFGLVSCSSGSDDAASLALIAAAMNSTQSQNLRGKNISIKDFSKYSAIGAAYTKSDSDAEKTARLVGQDSNGNIEEISLEIEGKDSDLNQRPLQFFRAFKRFVFFIYWPKFPVNFPAKNFYADYPKMLDFPKCFGAPSVYSTDSSTPTFPINEPMFVLDKSNGKIYTIGADEGDTRNYSSICSAKWSSLRPISGNAIDCGDRFYIRYTYNNFNFNSMSGTDATNYYVLTLTDNQLQESYIVKDADPKLFNGMYVDRFGNLFANDGTNKGNGNNNVKYYIASDGSKTKINYADNLHICNSNDSSFGVYYYSDGTFRTYNTDSSLQHIDLHDIMEPKGCSSLFMAANGYVYQSCKNSPSRTGVYKRYNANGQLEDCDWVPEGSQEYYFAPGNLAKEEENAKYYFVTSSESFNGGFYSSQAIENVQPFDSNGQPAKVKKYDFTTGNYLDEEIPVVLKSYTDHSNYNCDTGKRHNTIYKVQFTDSSKNQFTVTEIPLEDFESSDSNYCYYNGCNNYAITKKYIFFIKDGELIAYNIENGKKNSLCSKSDMVFGTIYPSKDSSKIFFTATSRSSNDSIRGAIDDNGLVEQNTTNYEVKYLAPIN